MVIIKTMQAGKIISIRIDTNDPVCYATHPNQPNYDGHARGRKLHFVKNKKYTHCNMLVDVIKEPSPYDGSYGATVGVCKSCINSINRK